MSNLFQLYPLCHSRSRVLESLAEIQCENFIWIWMEKNEREKTGRKKFACSIPFWCHCSNRMGYFFNSMCNLIESLDFCFFDFDPIKTMPLSINPIWLLFRTPISRRRKSNEKKTRLEFVVLGYTQHIYGYKQIKLRNSFGLRLSRKWADSHRKPKSFSPKISNFIRTHIEIYLSGSLQIALSVQYRLFIESVLYSERIYIA